MNAFDWQAAYPEILAGGGFDAVIGAPPAHRPFPVKSREEYFQMHYGVYAKTAGLYGYFIEKGLALLKPGGVLSFFVPEPFLRAHHARPLRRLLLTTRIEEIVEVGGVGILAGAAMRSYILRIAKKEPDQPILVSRAQTSGFFDGGELTILSRFAISQSLLDDGGWTLEDRRVERLVEKLRAAGAPLEDYVIGQIEQGTVPLRNNPFIVDAGARARFIKKDWRCKKFFRPLLRPADIRRYRPETPDRFVISVKNIRDLKRCRAVWKSFKEVVKRSGITGLHRDFCSPPRKSFCTRPQCAKDHLRPVPALPGIHVRSERFIRDHQYAPCDTPEGSVISRNPELVARPVPDHQHLHTNRPWISSQSGTSWKISGRYARLRQARGQNPARYDGRACDTDALIAPVFAEGQNRSGGGACPAGDRCD